MSVTERELAAALFDSVRNLEYTELMNRGGYSETKARRIIRTAYQGAVKHELVRS